MKTAAFAVFLLLAINFATYFAEDEISPEEMYKDVCIIHENKAMLDAMNDCQKEKLPASLKELIPICAKKLGIESDFSVKSLTSIFCVQGGDKIYYQFDKCQNELMVEKKITKEMERNETQPMMDCFNEKMGVMHK